MDHGAPAGIGEVPAARNAAGSVEVALWLAEDRDRIAQAVNDVVVRRLFAAGLDLESALGLMGEHRATARICHAVGELDQAIRDLRDTITGYDRALTDDRGVTGERTSGPVTAPQPQV
jgi:signal transduction histidine kinase